MPRQLLRDGRIVADDWAYLEEIASDAAPARPSPSGVILTMDQWLADRARWLATGGRLGLLLMPEHQVEALVDDLARFALIAARFPNPAEGRGYSQARLLRERHGFSGELRATGHVRRDQLFFLARCGFNSFELAEADLGSASSALRTFSAEYQPSNDAGLAVRLPRR
jgi:uncharacterized protein (DUF934 family)